MFLTREVEPFPGFKKVRDSLCHEVERFFTEAGSARSTFMERDLSLSGVSTGKVIRKNLAVSLPQTGLPLMEDVKVGDVVAEMLVRFVLI